jgi:hypothetical protein
MQLLALYTIVFFGCAAYAVLASVIRLRWGVGAVLAFAALVIFAIAAADVWMSSEKPAAALLMATGPIALASTVVLSAPSRSGVGIKLAAAAGALGMVGIFAAAWTALILGWTRDSF